MKGLKMYDLVYLSILTIVFVLTNGFSLLVYLVDIEIVLILLWIIGGFTYPVCVRVIEKNKIRFIGNIMKVLAMFLISQGLSFLTYAIRKKMFNGQNLDSLQIFMAETRMSLVFVSVSFMIGFIFANYFSRTKRFDKAV